MYDIEKAFRAIEDELMKSMIRNMKRHCLDEVEEKKQWEMWQVLQLKSLEEYKQANRKKFQSTFSRINKEVAGLISEARSQGGMEQEIKILQAIKKGFKPVKGLKASTETMGEFFKLNDRKLEALIKATQNDFDKAERAVLRMAEDQYRQVIFNAQVYANTGAGTYEKAVDMATKDFLNRGLNCIEYANGARHTIADYAAMAIQTATKRAYLMGEGEKRKEWGITTVIMNKRGNACPKCLPFVGKVLIDDVWSGGKRSDGPYMLMSYAMSQGLYHPRCKDVHTTYFEGISTPGASYTKNELLLIESEYKEEQKQQYAKRQAEKFSRLEKYSLDKDNQQKYKTKANMWKRVRFRTGDLSPMEYATDKGAYSSKFSDVTQEWLKNSKSKQYRVEELLEITVNETNYKVDGVNVLHNNSPREIEVAELLKPIFEEKISLVPEVKGKYKGVKTSDYLIGDKRWDLKELKGESKDAVRNAISKCKAQADHFIIDITSSKLDKEEIIRQVENVFSAPNTRFVKTLIVIDADKVVRIIRRK